MKMAVEMMWSEVPDLDAFIGSGCSVVCQPVALLAAIWGIPVVAWACSSPSLSDKSIYPTFTRNEASEFSRNTMYIKLAEMFGWRRVCVIATTEDLNRLTALGLMKDMEGEGIEVILQLVESTVQGTDIHSKNLEIMQSTIEGLKHKARIFIIITYPNDARNILISAYDAKMMSGDYVFIAIEFVLSIMNSNHTHRPEMEPYIYDGLLAVGPRVPSGPRWDLFCQQVIDAFEDEHFDNYTHIDDPSLVEVFAGINISLVCLNLMYIPLCFYYFSILYCTLKAIPDCI